MYRRVCLVALVASVLYLFLSLVVSTWPAINTLEANFLESLSQVRNDLMLHFAGEIGSLGSTMVVILISISATIVFLLFELRKEALYFAFVVIGSGVLTGISKLLVQRARPEGLSESLGFYTSSYPSGHTLSATAMYLSLAYLAGSLLEETRDFLRRRRIMISLAMLFASLVAAARVISTTHYPTDSLAGLLAGTAWAALMAAQRERQS